jgi:hypothetical protein
MQPLLDKLLPSRLREIIEQKELASKIKEIPNHIPMPDVPLEGEQIVLQFIMVRMYYNYLRDLQLRRPDLIQEGELEFVRNNLQVVRDELKTRWKILKELANTGIAQMLEISIIEGGLKREE